MKTRMLTTIKEIVMNGNERDGMLSLKGIIYFKPAIHGRAQAIHGGAFSWPAIHGRARMIHRAAFVWILAGLLCALAVQTADAADAKQIYQESTDALYNLDFSTAQHGFESLTRDYSDNPDYWNALASSIWLKIMYDQQKLNIESFSGGSSFGTKESRDAINPADEKSLRDTLATAMAKANAVLQKHPKDIHALYALGVSHATLASFEASAKRSYFSAHSKMKTARGLHQEVLKLDPAFDDARLSVGAYDYVIGVIPGFFRLLLGVFGIRGAGKEAGIHQLETAAAKGKSASIDARMLLVVIHTREKNYDQALMLTKELHAKYPRNFLFELAEGIIYGKMKRWDDAAYLYEQILANIEAKRNGYDRLRQGKVFYQLAISDVERLQFDQATDAFTHVTLSKDSPPDEKASAYLWLGKIYDSKNDRTKALQQYDSVLGLNCDSELKTEAQRYKRNPYKS